MKLVISVKRSQLRGVLEELGRSFPDMDIVINIKEEESKEEESKEEESKEEESKEKTLDYQNFTTEQLQRIDKEMKEKEKEKEEEEEKEKYPT